MKRLDITMLGRFDVAVDGQSLAPGAFAQRRAADLVKVLALAPGHRLPRDRVVELLWGALGADAGTANLHKAAHYARRALGDQRAVVLRQGVVELAPDVPVSTDVERYEAGDAEAYGGELLPDDPYEEWVIASRDRLRSRRVDHLRAAGRWHEVLDLEPADEHAHRELLRADLEAGDRLAAARRFRRLSDELSRLGLQPSDETLALHRGVAAGPAVDAPLTLDGSIVGRKAELAVAARALSSAAKGLGSTLVLTGEPGIGKTRYVEALLRAARRQGWHTLRGRAHGDEASMPYRPVVEALGPLLLERPDLLAGLAAGARAALARLSPAAASQEEPAGPVERHAALAALAQLLRAAAAERGVLLALEDLHAADEATLQLVDYLATAAPGQRLLLVAGARPVAAGHGFAALRAALLDQRTGTEVVLDALDGDSIRELAALAAARPLTAAALDAIERAAAGNPFYAQELAAAADDSGVVRIPERLHQVLDVRLERLPPRSARLLAVLAAADDGFSARELASVAGEDVAGALADAAAGGVLRDDGAAGWHFRHPLLREAAARRIAAAELAAAHAAWAERLSADGAAPERVAHHLLASGRGPEAVPLLAEAAGRAAAIGAYADGRHWVEQALEHAPADQRPGLYALLADLRFATGDRAAVAAYTMAVQRASDDDVPGLKVKQAMAAMAAGDLDAAERALAGLPAGTPYERGMAALALGWLNWFRGDIDEAARQADEAQALSEASGQEIARLTNLRAMVAHAQGSWESHAEWELGHVWHIPQLAGNVFDAYLCVTEYVLNTGDPYEQLVAFASQLHDQARQAGARRGQAFAATVLGEVELLSGRPEAARDRLLEATRLSRQVGAVGGESLARARLGEALAELGDHAGARAHLEEAIELAHASSLSEHLLYLVPEAQLRIERENGAAVAVLDACELLLPRGALCRFCPVGFALEAASVCARDGQVERAEAFLAMGEASVAFWPRGTWSPGLCEARGELALARGAHAEAATLLRRAVDGYAASGQRLRERRAAAALDVLAPSGA